MTLKIRPAKPVIVFFFLLLLTRISLPLQAQNFTVHGRVTPAGSNDPVPDVMIYVEETNVHTISDSDGTFRIMLPAGKDFLLKAACIGYKEFTTLVHTGTGEEIRLDIQLVEDVTEIEEVNIIKDKRETEILTNPSIEPLSLELATTTITRDEIMHSDSRTIVEAMAFSPGAFVETRGRKVKQLFSVRGQKYPYPEYAINGIWQREFQETPYFFSTANVERIEIIRSSAALLHGLSGMSGIVNIVTRKFNEPETNGGLEYGSFNTLHAFLTHGGQKGTFNYSFGAGYDKTDGPRGFYARERMLNLYGTLEWNPSPKVSVTANVFHLNGMRQFMQARYPAMANLISGKESYDPFVTSSVSIRALIRQSETASLEVQTFYTERRPVYVNEVTGKTNPENDFETGANVIQSVSLGHSNILRFGALYNHWDAPEGKRYYAGRKTEVQTISGVIADEQEFGKLNLNAGIRWVKTYIDEYGAFGIDGSGNMFKDVEPLKDIWQPGTVQATGGMAWQFEGSRLLSLNFVSGAVKPREGALDENMKSPVNEWRTMIDLGIKNTWKNLASITLTGFWVNQNNAVIYSGDILEFEAGKIR